MRAVCNVKKLNVGYRFEFELSELIPRFFKLKDMRVGANQITDNGRDRQFISASVTPAQSCLSSFRLFRLKLSPIRLRTSAYRLTLSPICLRTLVNRLTLSPIRLST